jgi:hypothetical protein
VIARAAGQEVPIQKYRSRIRVDEFHGNGGATPRGWRNSSVSILDQYYFAAVEIDLFGVQMN